MEKSNSRYFYLFIIIFFCGVNNDPLSVRIIKDWKLVEILTIPLVILLFYVKNNIKYFNFQKIALILVIWCFISLIINKNTLPFDYFVTDSKNIFTMYGTRGWLVSGQLLFYILLSVFLLNYLYYLKISQSILEMVIIKAITLFALIGIVIVSSQILGVKFPFVQSNELSYSTFRLFSLSREPQYAGLWLSFGFFIAMKRKKFIPLSIILLAILLTRSSSVIAGLLVAFFWIYFFKIKIQVKLVSIPIVIIALFIVSYLTADKILAFYNSLSNVNSSTSDFARSYSMYVALKLIPDNFITGIGLGNFPYFFEWRGEEKIFNIANIFIRIMTECGIVGIFFFVLFVRSIIKALKKSNNEYFCILIVLFVYFMVNSTYLFFASFWFELTLLCYLSGFSIGGNYVKES